MATILLFWSNIDYLCAENQYIASIMEKVIVGIGEVLWDLLPAGKKLGGAPANFARHIGRFGFDSCVVSAVGKDPAGDEIIARFDDMALPHCIERLPFPTGTVAVTLDNDGIPRYRIQEQVAWDNIPYTPRLEALAQRTQAVCFGSLAQRSEVSRQTINRFIDSIPEENRALKVFDVNLRQAFYGRQLLHDSMCKCNILKINDEELAIVAPMMELTAVDPQERCRQLLDRYRLDTLILTCGVQGSYVFTPQAVSFLPTPKVDVVDTVGAGDSFTAAFIASLLRGHSIPEAHQRAVDVSAFICTQPGATPALPENLTGR